MTSEINRCYRTLELEPGASLEQVKQAWHELAKVWHPDRFPNDTKLQRKAQERLKGINGAYEILKQYLTSGTRPRPRRQHESQHTSLPAKSNARVIWGIVFGAVAVLLVLANAGNDSNR
jgi:preprotein translocase subunit Sec63